MSYEATDEPRTPYELQDQIFQDAWPFWRERIEATDRLSWFLSGERYAIDQGQFNKDRRGIQIRGQEIPDVVSHVMGKLTDSPRSVEGRPTEPSNVDESVLTEAMVALITNELSDPCKGFDREDYQALKSACEGRRGCVWLDKVDNYGPYGAELFYSFQQNGTWMYDAAYHPHHPMCQWMSRLKRVDYRQANRDYGVDWLRPDYERLQDRSKWGIPLLSGFTDRITQQAVKDKRVTIRETWLKNDPTVDPSKPSSVKQNVLKPDERYMRCKDGCASIRAEDPTVMPWRSPTFGSMKRQGLMRKPFPKEMPGAAHEGDPAGCPLCGAALERIDATEMSTAQLMYANGRRLIVAAPFCPGPDGNEHLFDGGWPIPGLRSFPALFYFASVKPGDNTGGPCYVDAMWDQQAASDNLMTMAVQRVFEHRDYWVMPHVGFYNVRGDRFEFRDDDENLILQDMRKTRDFGLGNTPIQHIGGTGLDSAWGEVYAQAQSALRAFVPKADLEPNAQASRDIPVGTAQQMVTQSEVSTEDFKRRNNDERSIWYGIMGDAIQATYTPERIARIGIEGTDHLVQLWGSSMPRLDYVVSESPPFTGLDEQRQKAWDSALQVVQTLGPEALESWAQFHNVPRSVVRNLQKMIQAKQQEAEQAQAQAVAAGGAPGGQGLPTPGAGAEAQQPGPGAPTNAGPTSAGIPSAAAA